MKTAARRLHTTTVTVAKGLPAKEGRQKVLRKASRQGHGDARGVTYNPRTGKGKVI